MKLNKRIFIKGFILAETGLLIGGTDTGQGMSGADKVVLRNPINDQPFIPGSSLKGKLRTLLEQLAGLSAEPKNELSAKIARLFGTVGDDKTENPRMLVVRDANLANHQLLDQKEHLDLPYTELKTEAAIDRITAKATPHCYERVPAGAVFGFEIVLTAYDFAKTADDAKEYAELVLSSLLLLQDDYLGANGSRGYGKVRFHIENVTMRDADGYLKNAEPQPFTEISVPAELQFDDSLLETVKTQIS